MNRWFRFYGEALNDHKVQSLSPDLFKTWVNLLCAASLNDGVLPTAERLSFELRVSAHEMQTRLDDLILLGLLDIRDDKRLEPHNWSRRQWKSDDSKERVRKFRAKNAEVTVRTEKQPTKRPRNDDVTVTVTPPDTESDTEKKQSSARETRDCATLPDRFVDRMVEAAGDCLANSVNCLGLLTEATPRMWLDSGCDLERDILPTLRAAAKKYAGRKISSWSYFTGMISEAKAKRLAGMPVASVQAKKQPSSTFSHPPKERDEDWQDEIARQWLRENAGAVQ